MVRLLVSVLILLCTPFSFAGIAVEPAFVQLNFNQGRASGRFVVTNTGAEEERYRILASFFSYNEEGQVQVSDPDEHSMAAWIKFNPKEFVLPPNSKRAVRYVVLPRGKIADGEYWAAMELESLEGRNYSTEDEEGRTFNLKVVPSILAPLYGYSGKITHKINIEKVDLSVSDRNIQVLEMSATNPGNGILRLRGNYEVLSKDGEKLSEGLLDSGLLLPDRKRKFVSYINPKLESGDYILRMIYKAGGIEPIERELPFSINFVSR